MHQVLEVHSILFTEIWLLNISIKKQKEFLVYFAQVISDIYRVKKLTKTYIFKARCEHFTTGRQIDKELVYGHFHAVEFGNKHFGLFS